MTDTLCKEASSERDLKPSCIFEFCRRKAILQRYQFEIQGEAMRRGVSQLFHFTVAGNVKSILSHGLASRVALEEQGIPFIATDRMRLDDCLDGASLSIHSINQSMFAAKNRTYREEWVILAFDASILWTHPCRFCWVNAASREIRRHSGFLGGPWAFRKMFEDRPISLTDRTSARNAWSRDDFEPTNNDAEVQVLSPIAPELILGGVVRNKEVKGALEELMEEIDRVKPVIVNEDIFP